MKTIVTAAVLVREGKVLIARRGSGAHAGKWEFPGGKCESGERPAQCLARELGEEFRGQFRVGRFIATTRFAVGGRPYELHAYRVELQSETIQPLEHDAISWVSLPDLRNYDLLEPDLEIVKSLEESGGL